MYAGVSFFGEDPVPPPRTKKRKKRQTTLTAPTAPTALRTLATWPGVAGTAVAGEYSVPLAALAALDPLALETVRSELTVKPRLSTMAMPGADPSFPLYRVENGTLHVPVFWGLRRFGGATTDDRGLGTPVDVPFHGRLLDKNPPQASAVSAVTEELSRRGGALLVLPCGFGKTVCALKLISDLGRKTLVVVHKEFLLDQWVERMAQFLPTARVGRIQQKKVDVENKDVVMGMLQSICLKDYPPALWRQFGAVIFDETHHIAAVRFKEAVRKLPCAYKIGLTATPDRSDGLGRCIPWLLGDVAFRAGRRSDERVDVFRVVYARGNQKEIRIHYGPLRGKVGYSQMVTRITKDRRRNDLLGLLVEQQVKTGRYLLVLTERVAHVQLLERFLRSLLCPAGSSNGAEPTTIGVVKGGDKAEAREAGFKCQIVLSTYQYASEGLDIKRMDTLFLASPAPTAKLEQCVGRVLRPCADKLTPRVFDVVDPFSVFFGTSTKRCKYYRSEGYRVVDVDAEDPQLLSIVA